MGFRHENGSDPLAEDYYMLNSHGDVLILVDGSGKLVVKYIYDTCGQHMTITGSMKDPLTGNNLQNARLVQRPEACRIPWQG